VLSKSIQKGWLSGGRLRQNGLLELFAVGSCHCASVTGNIFHGEVEIGGHILSESQALLSVEATNELGAAVTKRRVAIISNGCHPSCIIMFGLDK
jgi:hypothetical protein